MHTPTTTFLRTVLPTTGVYVLTSIDPSSKIARNHAFGTIEDMASAIPNLDRPPHNIYHACATFHPGRDANRGLRTAQNAAFVRSLWVDVDVGRTDDATHYSSPRTAGAAAVQFAKDMHLPEPHVVLSGRGLHLYWAYDRDVPVEEAMPVATAFKAAAAEYGFRIDPTPTADMARILRPVGTTWRKNGKEQPVRWVFRAEPISFDLMRERVAPFSAPTATPSAPSINDEWGIGEQDFPPSSALRVAERCAAIREVAETRGVAPEPIWRAAIGLTKYCDEGSALAHEWSKGDGRYSFEETQAKFERWSGGPPTCEYLGGLSAACQTCEYQGKVTTPVTLGEHAPSSDDDEADALPPEQQTPFTPDGIARYANLDPKIEENPIWLKGYRWTGVFLQRYLQDPDDKEKGEWVTFTDKLFYPFMRLRADDGTFCLRVCTKGRGKNAEWRTFDLPTSVIVDNKQLSAALAAREIFAHGKDGIEFMRYFLQDMLRQLERNGVETMTYNHLGWIDDGFLLGPSLLTTTSERPAVLSSRVHRTMQQDFSPKGSLEEWVRLVDTVYNRPGAEPYQFLFLAAFASPLVGLVDSELWHGIPVALTGNSGLGKSTTCQAACSIYGPPKAFTVQANTKGTTYNALLQRIASMHSLPMVMDEMHALGEDLPGVLYALANGMPKETLRADRSFRDDLKPWDLITLITANCNLTSQLSLYEREMAEATQLRIFEIHLPNGFNQRVFGDINAKDLIETQLMSNYGHAGRRFLQAVMRNMDSVKRSLHKARIRRIPNDQETTRERFFYDLLATTIVAGRIARRCGLIKFDLNAIEAWAIENIRRLRDLRANTLTTFEDRVQVLLSDLVGRTATTDEFPQQRSSELVAPKESILREPIARQVAKDGTLIIVRAGLRDWCARRQVDMQAFIAELDRHGYLAPPERYGVASHGKLYPFRGTNLPVNGMQCRAVILNLQKMREDGAIGAGELRAVSSPEQSPVEEAAVSA